MKKTMNLVAIISLLFFTACSTVSKKTETPEERFTREQIKNWEVTIDENLKKNAQLPEWYGEENAAFYLRKTGKMSQKDFDFLSTLSKKSEDKISEAEMEQFTDLVKKYNKNLPREFYLNDENIKNPSGLVKRMVSESYLRMSNPSNHIFREVADTKEWDQIVAWSKQADMSAKDVTKLRKLLNKFIKRSEFFDSKAWYNREISGRMNNIVHIDAKESKSKRERNNVNAKALYIAYPEYFSKMDRWDD
ncbi:MAG: hypothetical protein ACRCU6_07525 [Fusobacteriaceae bacterium]